MSSRAAPPGLLLVDKPQGITSFSVVARLRRHFSIKKIGHAGTLDPLATGLLIVGIGHATRLLGELMLQDKVYEVSFELGKRTTTDDIEGEVMTTCPVDISEGQLQMALARFVGNIEQVPPDFSAVKVNGRRAYTLARQGQGLTLRPRPVLIHGIELLSFEGRLGHLRVSCSKGTYVRSLIRDLGADLGCGATVTGIRRLQSGIYDVSQALSLENLLGRSRLPGPGFLSLVEAFPEAGVLQLPDELYEQRVRHGQGLRPADLGACVWLRKPQAGHVIGVLADQTPIFWGDMAAGIRLQRVFGGV